MRTYTLQREQVIPRPAREVFAFFANAANLETITPPWLKFEITGATPAVIARGTHIAYRLRWRWLPISWLTEIVEWQPCTRFVDVQKRGPYALWHHTHEFEEMGPNETSMRDIVRYALPLGSFGTLAHRLIVRRDVQSIFDYRADRIRELFPQLPLEKEEAKR
jgi:ligand-binding SRPBCC domain-containing protein